MQNEAKFSTDEIQINRARLDSITVYDVTEEELDIIESGSPSSNYLNFSIALISIAASFTVSLLTTKIEDTRVFILFFIVAFLSAIIGLILLLIWWRTNKHSKKIFVRIRNRKSADVIRKVVDNVDNPDSTGSIVVEAD